VELLQDEPCKMPQFMYMMFACERKYNFLNCPTYLNSTDCALTKEIVEKSTTCAHNYDGEYFMRQEFWWWEDLLEETDHFPCLVWQLF
jgi:hypothetical protein